MTYIPESELIINPDGSIYHLNLRPEHLAKTIITVGDPDRVAAVSQHFDKIEFQIQKREFVTHTGYLGTKRISVISTGIGTDNIDIVLNELDALVNVDFKERKVKEQHTSLDIIRIGTSGCLQEDIPVNSFLISSFGIGLDGLMLYYDYKNNADETLLQYDFMEYRPSELNYPIRPYLAQGSTNLIEKVGQKMIKGITLTCPGFYAPQGRKVRANTIVEDFIPLFADFQHKNLRITNFEMETAGIYGMARLLEHRAISCNVLLANRQTGEFSSTPKETVDKLIKYVLEQISD